MNITWVVCLFIFLCPRWIKTADQNTVVTLSPVPMAMKVYASFSLVQNQTHHDTGAGGPATVPIGHRLFAKFAVAQKTADLASEQQQNGTVVAVHPLTLGDCATAVVAPNRTFPVHPFKLPMQRPASTSSAWSGSSGRRHFRHIGAPSAMNKSSTGHCSVTHCPPIVIEDPAPESVLLVQIFLCDQTAKKAEEQEDADDCLTPSAAPVSHSEWVELWSPKQSSQSAPEGDEKMEEEEGVAAAGGCAPVVAERGRKGSSSSKDHRNTVVYGGSVTTFLPGTPLVVLVRWSAVPKLARFRAPNASSVSKPLSSTGAADGEGSTPSRQLFRSAGNHGAVSVQHGGSYPPWLSSQVSCQWMSHTMHAFSASHTKWTPSEDARFRALAQDRVVTRELTTTTTTAPLPQCRSPPFACYTSAGRDREAHKFPILWRTSAESRHLQRSPKRGGDVVVSAAVAAGPSSASAGAAVAVETQQLADDHGHGGAAVTTTATRLPPPPPMRGGSASSGTSRRHEQQVVAVVPVVLSAASSSRPSSSSTRDAQLRPKVVADEPVRVSQRDSDATSADSGTALHNSPRKPTRHSSSASSSSAAPVSGSATTALYAAGSGSGAASAGGAAGVPGPRLYSPPQKTPPDLVAASWSRKQRDLQRERVHVSAIYWQQAQLLDSLFTSVSSD